jgi:ribosomal protein S18 acetylase RimI-like enzyme
MAQTRPATPADIPVLVEFWYERALLQQTRLAADARERWTRAALKLLESRDAAMFVGLDGEEQLIGYVTCQIQPSPPGTLPEQQGVIGEIAIDAHHYHEGTGRLLVGAAREWFHSRAIDHFIVLVSQRSAVEQAFWRGLGAVKWMEILWIK